MRTTTTHLFVVVLLGALFFGTGSVESSSVSEQVVGAADCFNQKLSSFLDHLVQYCQYICTANYVNGEALPGTYDPFGSRWAFPVMNSEEASLYELYFGRPDEGFVAVSRNGTSATGLVGYYQLSNTTYRLGYPLDSLSGELDTSVTALNTSYTPTDRIWYQGALASSSGVYVTSTPYTFSSIASLGISVSQQCLRGGNLEVISSTAALLSVITTSYLTQASCSQFASSNGAVAYVVSSQGTLVLESDAVLVSVINATESSSAVVRTAAAYALQQGFSVSSVSQGQFSYNGETWDFYSRPVSASSWDWALVVVMPSSSGCSSSVSSRSHGWSW